MSDVSPPEQPVADPTKPLGVNVGTHASTPVSVAEDPVVSIPAFDYEAARAMINIMEAELETIRHEALYDANIILGTLRKRREETARRYLSNDKRLACIVPEDRDGILKGLMQEFDESLDDLKKSYADVLLRFTAQKAAHLFKLRELLKFDGALTKLGD